MGGLMLLWWLLLMPLLALLAVAAAAGPWKLPFTSCSREPRIEKLASPSLPLLLPLLLLPPLPAR